jgi:hypothetical protein
VIDFGDDGAGRGDRRQGPAPRSFAEDLQAANAPLDSKHPTPLTREEVLRLR